MSSLYHRRGSGRNPRGNRGNGRSNSANAARVVIREEGEISSSPSSSPPRSLSPTSSHELTSPSALAIFSSLFRDSVQQLGSRGALTSYLGNNAVLPSNDEPNGESSQRKRAPSGDPPNSVNNTKRSCVKNSSKLLYLSNFSLSI